MPCSIAARPATSDATWAAPVHAGRGNWVPNGATSVPAAWTDTRRGADPGLVSPESRSLWPAPGSALVDSGVLPTVSPPGHEFPAPLAAPRFMPPRGVPLVAGAGEARPEVGIIDIGAFELAR